MTLAPVLSNLTNKSLTQGLFPQPLKISKILPIFKSKDKLMNLKVKINYRPISILPVISKVNENVFYSRLYDFSANNILSSWQFGFRSGASNEQALLKFTDDILKCLDDNKVGIATVMNLSKAFDCVSLREISGTYWLTWVSLAIVSRLTRIIWSIDPTVANFQVSDPDLCEIRRDENHNLPLSQLLNLLYYTTEKCRFESHSDIAFSWKFVLFSIHITLLWEDIYTPCLFCTY